MKRLAILISNTGTGTNLKAIIDGIDSGKIKAKIVVVLSDTSEAQALRHARSHHLPVKICPRKELLPSTLSKYAPDFICLAGFKQIIGDKVIETYHQRILNTHPGLIPDTIDGQVKNPDKTLALWNRGKMTNKAIQNFLDNKATYAGCTNHFLSHQFDFGKVLGRCFEKIRPNDTIDSLYSRLKKKENQLYVKVLQKLCN